MRARYVVAAAVVLLLTSLSCFSERVSTTEPTDGECSIPTSAFGRNRAVVIIRGFAFLPDTLRVRPGTTVTWVNCEPPNIESHTSTSSSWDSGLLAPGDFYAREFAAAGTFNYLCTPHPTIMRGVVIVQ